MSLRIDTSHFYRSSLSSLLRNERPEACPMRCRQDYRLSYWRTYTFKALQILQATTIVFENKGGQRRFEIQVEMGIIVGAPEAVKPHALKI